MYKIYLQVRSKIKASLCLSIYIFYLVDWGKLCLLKTKSYTLGFRK